MSKSYGKYKSCGIATGSNTKWYRMRRKYWRRVNRNRFRNIISKYDNEEIDENFNPYIIPKKNTWEEPTDGTVRYDYKRIKKMMEKFNGWTYGMYLTKDNKVKK